MRQIVAPDLKQFPIAVFKSILAGDIKQIIKPRTGLSNRKEKTQSANEITS
jgi:hypothetical protein